MDFDYKYLNLFNTSLRKKFRVRDSYSNPESKFYKSRNSRYFNSDSEIYNNLDTELL